MAFLAPPLPDYMPKDMKSDPDMAAAWNDMNTLPTAEGRQDAFARMQKITLDRVYALPFGSFTKVQATRANVQGFKPFRIPRVSNVWFAN
jgi:peptide/nickel transport system substrate-binding protein